MTYDVSDEEQVAAAVTTTVETFGSLDMAFNNAGDHGSACRLPPAACRLPPAACRLPPAACRLPPAACRLPPAAADEDASAFDAVTAVNLRGIWASSMKHELKQMREQGRARS